MRDSFAQNMDKTKIGKSFSFKLLSSAVILSFMSFSSVLYAKVEDRIIVKYKDAPSSSVGLASARSVMNRLTTRSGVQLQRIRSMDSGGQLFGISQTVSATALQDIMSEFANDSSVEYVERDLIMRAKFTPNDPRYANQWHYFEPNGGMNLPAAWNYGVGKEVVVAVLDTGYRPHADLKDNILPGYDFVSDKFMGNDGDGRDSDATDPGDAMFKLECDPFYPPEAMQSSWHGTHVAGTIAAVTNNGIGVAGVAPNAKIVPVRVLGKCGGFSSDIVDAIRWSAGLPVSGVPNNQHPAKVINLSLGSDLPEECSPSYADAIAAARAAGAVVVIAAGNEESRAEQIPPGNCPGSFTVAATNRNGGRASYSNYGSVVDIAAPGGLQRFINDSNGVLSTSNSGLSGPSFDSYLYLQGTSMAAPNVSGVAALLFGLNPSLKPQEVEEFMTSSARPFPESCVWCGAGIVDAAKATAVVAGDLQLPQKANLTVRLKGDTGKFIKDNSKPGSGRIRFMATVTNQGPNSATANVLSFTLPNQVKVDSLKPTQGNCRIDSATCELGNITNDASVNVVVEVVTSNIFFMNFSATVKSESVDVEMTNNVATNLFGGALTWMIGLITALGVARVRYQHF